MAIVARISTKHNEGREVIDHGQVDRHRKQHAVNELDQDLFESTKDLVERSDGRSCSSSLQESVHETTNSHLKHYFGVTELDSHDVEVGALLGQGSFSHVHEIKCVKRATFLASIALDDDTDSDASTLTEWNVSYSSDRSNGSGGGSDCSCTRRGAVEANASKSFVVKHLNTSIRRNRKSFRVAVSDLALEAEILSFLAPHPHIVRLRGVKRGFKMSPFCLDRDEVETDGQRQKKAEKQKEESSGSTAPSRPFPNDYFLVLDRLKCTLRDRMQEWSLENPLKKKSLIGRFFHKRRSIHLDDSPLLTSHSRYSTVSFASAWPAPIIGDIRPFASLGVLKRSADRDFLFRRLDVARQIASAMVYLHSQRIIYRDLKPENIGFDFVTDAVKIFDFGLSRFLPREQEDECHCLTMMTGTPRYMAPEVGKCEPYGLSADVYSFGILMWEILSMKKPFEDMNIRELRDRVVYGKERPMIMRKKWPEKICGLIERCWDADVSMRPAFRIATEVLQQGS